MAFDKEVYHKEYYLQNKAKYIATSARTYQRNKTRSLQRSKKWAKDNPARIAEIVKKSSQNRLKTLYEWMGNKCKCCGENDPMYFQIDHVNNDGHLDKKLGCFKVTIKRYQKNPERFQLLCANCNIAKHLNGGKLYKPKKKRKAA